MDQADGTSSWASCSSGVDPIPWMIMNGIVYKSKFPRIDGSPTSRTTLFRRLVINPDGTRCFTNWSSVATATSHNGRSGTIKSSGKMVRVGKPFAKSYRRETARRRPLQRRGRRATIRLATYSTRGQKSRSFARPNFACLPATRIYFRPRYVQSFYPLATNAYTRSTYSLSRGRE